VIGGSQYPQSVVKVLNANLGLSGATTADGGPATALQTITMTNAGTAGGTIVQYAQSQDGQQFFVPGIALHRILSFVAEVSCMNFL